MFLCTVSAANGDISGCANTGVTGLDNPTFMALANGYLYISGTINNIITKCTVNAATGALSGCASTFSITRPYGLVVNAAAGYALALSQTEGRVYRCDIGAAGAFTNCADSGAAGLTTSLFGLATARGFMYVPRFNAALTRVCTLNATGWASGCSDSTTILGSNPYGMIATPNGLPP